MLHTSDSAMVMSDAAFLAEVDDFLTSCDVSNLPSSTSEQSENNDSKNEASKTTSNSVKTPQRLVGITPPLASTRCLTTQRNEDAATKRELEKAKDRKRRRAYRERRRIERENLQKEIETLTEGLKKSQTHDSLLTSAWKMLADRQLAARIAAEEEQSRLVKAIDSRAALLEEFQKLVSERLVTPDNSSDMNNDTASYQHKRVELEPTDDAIFAAYIDGLDAIYAQTDKALRSRGLDATEPNWNEPSETGVKDLDTGYFLYGGKHTLPFDFREICWSRWCTAPLHHRQESRQLYKDVDDPDNTVAFKFRITTRLACGKIASVLQRIALRRYEENERMVIIWRLFTEGEGAFNGMNADETGWSVTIPAKNSAKSGTVMLTCVHNVPMHLSDVATRLPTVKAFAGKLVEWGSENNLKVTNNLKNLLLTGK